MNWGNLRKQLVAEVKSNEGKAIEIKCQTPPSKKVIKNDDTEKKEELKRIEYIELKKSQIYRKDDRFYDSCGDDVYDIYMFFKDMMWRNGFSFRDEGMGYVQFYEFSKKMSMEYKKYENEEKDEMTMIGLIDIETSDTDEYITPSDEYNLIMKSY